MDPCVGREWLAVENRGSPTIDVVPDVPLLGAIEITFRAPNPTVPSKRLIDVELESLRSAWIVDIEIQVVSKVAHVVSASDRVEVQHVAICRRTRAVRPWSAHAELSRFAVHRRAGNILSECGLRCTVPRRTDLTVAPGARRK